MTVENLGVKLYSGTKSDRVSDSLGSDANGTNTGITLVNGKEITWTSSGSTTTYNSVTKSASSAGWTNNYAHSQSYSSGIVIVEFDPNVGQGYGSLCGFDDGTNNSTPTDITLGMAGLTSASNCNTIVSGTATDHGSNSWASGDIMKVEYNIGTGAYSFYRNGGTAFRTGTISSPPSSVRILVSSYSQNYKVTEIKLSGSGTSATANLQKLGTGAYSFDGSNDYVSLGSTTDWSFLSQADAKWTITGWYSADNFSSNQALVGSSDFAETNDAGIMIRLNTDRTFRILLGKDSTDRISHITTLTTPNDTDWHFLCVQYDDSIGTLSISVDGGSVETDTGNNLTNTTTPDNPLQFGWNGHSLYFDGKLDDWSVWKRILGATAISTLSGVLSGTPRTSYNNLQSDSRNIAGTQFLTGHKLIGESVTKVKMRFKNLHSLSGGTITCKILNNDKSVKTTFSSISTGDIDSSTYEEFTFTGSATTIAVNDIICAEITNSASNDIEMGYSGAEANAQVVEKTSGNWSSSTSNSITYKVVESDGALVSSLSDKSEGKAYYSMNSTSLGATVTKETLDSTNGTSGWNVDNGGSDITIDTGNNEIDITGTGKKSGYYDLGTSVSTSAWLLRFKLTSSGSPSGNPIFWVGVFDANTMDSSSTSVDGISCMIYTGSTYKLSMKNNQTLDSGGSQTNTSPTVSADTTTRYIEIVRNGSNAILTFYDGDDYETSIGTCTVAITGSAFRYLCAVSYFEGSGRTYSLSDVKFYDGVSSLDGCKNDFSSTSALDGVTGVRTNSIFQQTDTPSYWWYNGTSWVLDGTTQTGGDDITTDITWTQLVGTSSNTFYVVKDTTNKTIDVKNAGNSGAYGSASIGYATLPSTLSSSAWIMRYKLKFITITNESTGGKSFHTNFFIVDDPDDAESSSNSANGFGVKFIADSGGGGAKRTYYYSVASGTYSSSTDMSYAPSNGAEMYFEYVYSSGTCTLNLYSDDTYETRLGSSTQNATKSGTFSGLKYPQIVLRQDNGGNGVMDIEMSDLKIQNGRTTWFE